MFELSSPSKRDKVSPQIITVEPTICEPNPDIESDSRTPVAVASAVTPTTWAVLNPTVMPEPLPRDQAGSSIDREQVLIQLYQRSRFIRIMAIIDCAFIIVFGLFQPIFFILIPFPICGYWGARKWIYRLLFIYTVYLVVEVIGGIISLIYIQSTAFIAVRIVYILVNMLIARYTTNLASYILVLNDEDFDFLKNSPVIVNTEKTLLC